MTCELCGEEIRFLPRHLENVPSVRWRCRDCARRRGVTTDEIRKLVERAREARRK